MIRLALPLVLTLAVQALVSMASLTAPVLAPEASSALGLDESLIGVFVGLIYAGAMLSAIASGDLVRRFGPIRMSQASLVLCGLGLSVAALGSVPALIAGALLIGLGYGPVTPASSHILARTTPAHRMGLTFSLKQTGVPLGGALAGGLVPSLVAYWTWRGAAAAVAASCLVMALAVQVIRPMFDADREPGRRVSVGSTVGMLRTVLVVPAIRDLAVCSILFASMQLILTTYLVTVLTVSWGMALVTAGLVLAAAQGAGVAGRLLWGWLADGRVEPRRLLGLLALVIAGCAIAFYALSPDWPIGLVVAVSMLFGGTAIGWNGVFLAEIARVAPPGMAGAATGASLFMTYFGVVVGPPVFAAIVGLTGSYATGFLIFGLIVVPMGLLLAATRARPLVSEPGE